MKTLADFKKAMTVGSKWEGYLHYSKHSFGIREVTRVNSVAFYFKSEKSESGESRCDFPKAKDIKFNSDGSVDIYKIWAKGYQLLLTYKQV